MSSRSLAQSFSSPSCHDTLWDAWQRFFAEGRANHIRAWYAGYGILDRDGVGRGPVLDEDISRIVGSHAS